MTRSRKGKIERIVAKGPLGPKVSHDDDGNFLHYCSYGHHYGVMGEEYVRGKKCVGCKHHRFYREVKKSRDF